MANGQLEQATLWAKQSTKEFSHSPCIGLSQQPCKVNDNSFVPTYEPVKTSSKADTSKNAFDKGASRSFALSSTHMYHSQVINIINLKYYTNWVQWFLSKKTTSTLLCHLKTEIWLKGYLQLIVRTVESKWMIALILYQLEAVYYSWKINSSKSLHLTVTPTRPVMEIISGMFWWQFWSLVARIFSIVAAFDWRVLRVLMASWRKNKTMYYSSDNPLHLIWSPT